MSVEEIETEVIAAIARPQTRLIAPSDIQEFLLMEANLLDERRLDEWLTLYTQDASYWVPAEHGDVDPEKRISLFYDDRSILEDRVWRLGHPKMFSQNPPVHQARVLSAATIDSALKPSDTAVITRTKFILFENRLREQRTFGGEYEHHLVKTSGVWMVAKKKVQLVNCDAVLWNIGVPI